MVAEKSYRGIRLVNFDRDTQAALNVNGMLCMPSPEIEAKRSRTAALRRKGDEVVKKLISDWERERDHE